MNGELLSLIDAIVRDKGIDRELLIQAIESALASAAKKGTGKEAAEVTVAIDRAKGHLTVVSDGKPISSAEFSRIGAQTAKQVIMQRIREAERDVVFGEYQDKVGAIASGTVHRFERGDIIVELGRAEGILPKSERIPYEDFRQGDRVQAYVLEVRKGLRGAEIVLSRAHEGFIRGLFALEVPEIADGTVEIKAIAREPGDRTKIAVFSKDAKVDSQGACIGMRGTRVKNIVRELHGERVDIIRWHESAKDYVAAALAPAQIAEIKTEDGTQQALVIVEDDQLSLAIGKKGQNVRLASKLTGWQLEIKSKGHLVSGEMSLRDLAGVGPTLAERLKEAGIRTVQQLAAMSGEQLTQIKGVGEKTAQKLLEAAQHTLAAKPAAVESAEAASAEVPSQEASEAALAPDAPATEVRVDEPTEPPPASGEASEAGES